MGRDANGQMGRYWIETMMDLDSDMFLNNCFNFGSDFNSEHVLLVSSSIPIGGPEINF